MDDFSIDEQSGVSIWMQIRNRMIYQIASGRYQPGEKMPTVREMAVAFGVNYNTVSKVYQSLERDGYIKTQRGKGTFAVGMPEDEDDPQGAAAHLADDFIQHCTVLGLSGEEIVDLVRSRLA
ncbi:MAG TPA: GntR family transcriptional regulator [Candidatus Aveggerthella stercoripullorum]|uniref:GntR family transcriptional regulator n=1 Tax=Candidatus Aveggerthella stercoripullorum TaxID=2840688 RepID=A0A9D1A128_9ACTN|nr:GntR family transcriptional regulator [Slackia piriformis]HIR02139.1 GntR family transcriptional regulator [Candidatus Aveggerthella stercoripullorum]